MRERKVRGMDTNGQWHIGLLSISSGKCALETGYYISNEYGMPWAYPIPIMPETIGDYTGLKDKNGKEIYEGDIFQAFGDKGLNREVLFRDACFGYEEEYMGFIPMKNINFGWNGGVSQRIEVVGNRFENPELLK